MNKTQELITNSYTIGHAVSTIQNLHESALQQIKLYKKENMKDSDTYVNLVTVFAELDNLLVKAIEVKEVIDSIDEKD